MACSLFSIAAHGVAAFMSRPNSRVAKCICFAFALGTSCEYHPDKPVETHQIASYRIPDQQSDKWWIATVSKDGKVEPTTISSGAIDWGFTYTVKSQMRWNGLSGLYRRQTVGIDNAESMAGTTYTIDDVARAHIEAYDPARGLGRFKTGNRLIKSGATECELGKGANSTKRCGREFRAEGPSKIALGELMAGKRKLIAVTLKHVAWPEPETVISAE